ncbi:hypothetical protein SADUNF_Sadunf10G0169000 [Salix dunnii]|uniref:Uncharacterized protein n=1 Tax=Salix dunnii TaxID=1413687 RepID=A0A835MZ30_9ROSI|nr:hypothetical protein SADUNF_Sadunf10G0169000 [Salix dunnii]
MMATGQVLFHRFYCKKSFAHFNVKIAAASCVCHTSMLEESTRKSRQVITFSHRMECRRESLPGFFGSEFKGYNLVSRLYMYQVFPQNGVQEGELTSGFFGSEFKGYNLVSRLYRCKEILNQFLPTGSQLKIELSKTLRHILKEMGFVCHAEHPRKFISNYPATLGTPQQLRPEAWNLANDSCSDCISFLRPAIAMRKIAKYFFGTTYHEISTLRFHHVKSIGVCGRPCIRGAVVACGVVYAAARRFQAPLPENQPWWKEFDAEISGSDDVCKVVAHLYSLPKAQYIVCKDGKFSSSNMSSDSQLQPVLKLGQFFFYFICF